MLLTEVHFAALVQYDLFMCSLHELVKKSMHNSEKISVVRYPLYV
jgi:hypothetical protein